MRLRARLALALYRAALALEPRILVAIQQQAAQLAEQAAQLAAVETARQLVAHQRHAAQTAVRQ